MMTKRTTTMMMMIMMTGGGDDCYEDYFNYNVDYNEDDDDDKDVKGAVDNIFRISICILRLTQNGDVILVSLHVT